MSNPALFKTQQNSYVFMFNPALFKLYQLRIQTQQLLTYSCSNPALFKLNKLQVTTRHKVNRNSLIRFCIFPLGIIEI